MKINWHPLDFFARDAERLARLQPFRDGLPETRQGVFVLPTKLREHAPGSASMALLGRDCPLMVTAEDAGYARNRNPLRALVILGKDQIRAEQGGSVVAILPADPFQLHIFMDQQNPAPRRITSIGGESAGIMYMCWGEKAMKQVAKSAASLQTIGIDMPVCVVGDPPPCPLDWDVRQWLGESPFDPNAKRNFQFRAGRVKPFLYEYTPFERTLYIDADTEFVGDFTAGFELLDDYDLALTEESLTLGGLYNKKQAGWEINLIERDATIQELGGDARRKFINSGVIFFRKSPAAQRVFEEWGRQWLRWQQWDEQLALMRAVHAVPDATVKALGVEWNHPHREQAGIIFHNYGRGVARMNVS